MAIQADRLCTLMIYMRNSPVAMRLVFATEDRAKQEHDILSPLSGAQQTISVSDDYSTKLAVDMASVSAVQLTDVIGESEANIEFGLLNARAQIKANKRAQQDPSLQQGQAIVNPGMAFPGGGFRQ